MAMPSKPDPRPEKDTVRYEVEDGVAWVYFNRPDKRNCMSPKLNRRFLDRYLPSTGKILDIGAATGVYTIPLAKKGFSVTAVDFSSNLIEKCKDRTRELGLKNRVTCLVADARDLSQVTDRDYDTVLLLGPLYHLVEEEDRKTALKEVYQRMKPGGVIFSAFIRFRWAHGINILWPG